MKEFIEKLIGRLGEYQGKIKLRFGNRGEFDFMEVDAVKEIVNELAEEYKDAEEQGLLLKLPCKVGDTVYSVTRDFISEYTICSIEMYKEGFFFNWKCEKGIYINLRGFTNFDIGKTVFLTKNEAEQALAGRNGV